MLYDIVSMKCPGQGKFIETGGYLPEDLRKRGEWRVTTKGYRVYFGGDKNVLELSGGDGCTTTRIYYLKGEFHGIRIVSQFINIYTHLKNKQIRKLCLPIWEKHETQLLLTVQKYNSQKVLPTSF